jgi:hypothetical protein
LATVEVNPARVDQIGGKSNGSISATLSVPPDSYKYLTSGTGPALPTTYKPSAKIFVYKLDVNFEVEKLVYSGDMIPTTGTVQVVPPSNSLREARVEYFETQINTGSRSGLNLYEAGNYRAEVIFYIQEYGMNAGLAVGWAPTPVEVAGAAGLFTISDFALAPIAEARGEISVVVSIVPRRGATAAQIRELESIAAREGNIASTAARSFLSTQTQKSPAGSAERQPWFYTESVKVGGAPSWNFLVSAGQTHLSRIPTTQRDLNAVVARGNVVRSTAGGNFTVRTATNIRFFPQ